MNPASFFCQYTESSIYFLQVHRPQCSQKQSTMVRTRRPTKRHGVQAKCSVLLSRLRPSAIVDTYFPNPHVQKRLQDLVCTKIEDATHEGCMTNSVFFSSPSIPNIELYCSKKFCIIIEDGPPEPFFNEEAVPADIGDNPDQGEVEIDRAVFAQGTGMRTSTMFGIKAWLSTMTMCQPLRTFHKNR